MMRRRGGTNKLKQPKKSDVKQNKIVSDIITGDIRAASTATLLAGAGTSKCTTASEGGTSSVIVQEIPGPSSSVGQTDSSCDFVFKRPKTPPPKTPRKGVIIGACLPESRRIRSKLKPGKTGFPIGASLHGLSRSEKLERRSKGKSRTNSDHYVENLSYKQHPDRIFEPDVVPKPNFPTGETSRGGGRSAVEQVITSYPRQTITKLKFPPPRQRSSSEQRSSKRIDNLQDQHGVKETLEICQGFSKVKIDDWYPLFDFHHSKRNASHVEPSSDNTAAENANKSDGDGDDEWEETLVYLDLEDIPDIDTMFATLSARKNNNGENLLGDEPLSPYEMKIFNMDSQLPVLRFGNKYLAGHWEESLGTSLFFKKKSEGCDGFEETTEATTSKFKLKSLVSEPEIPYDPIFGKNYDTQDQEDGYELVAKSIKILKARHFPVVTEELKGEDVIRDADDEFDHRDFQIPPVSMVRQFMPNDSCTFDDYLKDDIERRRKIHEKWGKTKENEIKENTNSIVKTEPLDQHEYSADDEDDVDSILFLNSHQNEPTAGPSKR